MLENEKKIHESLYTYIILLMKIYKPQKELLKMISPHMFYKPNSEAFKQVMYFLLRSLNKGETEKRITWPVYEKKMEAEFRNQVKQYLEMINDTYKNARLPSIVSSHMVSPGGVRIATLLRKLSQLVMVETKNKGEEPIILPITISDPKERKAAYGTLKEIVEDKRRKVVSEIGDNIQFNNNMLMEIREVSKNLLELSREINAKEKENEKLKNGLKEVKNSGETLEIDKIEELEKVHTLLQQFIGLVNVNRNTESVILNYDGFMNKDNQDEKNLDLCNFLALMDTNLQKYALQLNIENYENSDSFITVMNEILLHLNSTDNEFKEKLNKFNELCVILNNETEKIFKKNQNVHVVDEEINDALCELPEIAFDVIQDEPSTSSKPTTIKKLILNSVAKSSRKVKFLESVARKNRNLRTPLQFDRSADFSVITDNSFRSVPKIHLNDVEIIEENKEFLQLAATENTENIEDISASVLDFLNKSDENY